MKQKQLSLYLHSPFCSHKCGYCDFNSWVARNEQDQRNWVNALALELRAWQASWRDCLPKWHTVFLGGGTPSLLSNDVLAELGEILDRERVCEGGLKEFTAECNPEDIDKEKLLALRRLGVTRLSVGIQSFKKTFLLRLERQAEENTNRRALDLISQYWKGPWSLDLMYGLPDQTLSEWEEDLVEALKYKPPHLSAYQLTLSTERSKNWKQDSEDDLSKFFTLKRNILEAAGYEHYETSNFANEGAYSFHNLSYWELQEFLGIGPGAYGLMSGSFVSGQGRFGVHQRSKSKFDAWSEDAKNGDLSRSVVEVREPKIHLKELFLMGLRLKKGVPVDRLGGHLLGSSFVELPSIKGLLEEKNGNIFCTPKGSYLVDFINRELFSHIDRLGPDLDFENIDPTFGR